MKLADWMRANGKDRADAAAALGVSEASVCRYLTGARYPKPVVLRRIRDWTLNMVTADDFLNLEADRAA